MTALSSQASVKLGGRLPHLTAAFGTAVSAVVVAAETCICWYLLPHHLPDVVLVYLVGIVLLAERMGYAGSLPATAFSVAAFDFFFTAPYFSFDVADKRLLLTFLLMVFAAVVISNQTERLRRRQVRTATLYGMSRGLAAASSVEDVAATACRHVSDVFASEAWVLVADAGGKLRPVGSSLAESTADESLLATAARALDDPGQRLTASTDGERRGRWRAVALRVSTGVLGVLAIRPLHAPGIRTAASSDLFDLFVNQIAMALERAKLADDSQRAQVEVKTERLRYTLLSSVSHDLRTPLGVIKGAVTALIDGGPSVPLERQRENLETISVEATRLNRIVSNLLGVTSLEAGAVRARTEWQSLEEVVGVALNRLEEQLQGRAVHVRIEPEAALAPFDATLLEQVLVNLVENATKYSPARAPIEIDARRLPGEVEIEVADRGAGVPERELEAIFDKFHRANESASGMGLGLTICRGIVSAHGGRIWCKNRGGGGASFKFTLPITGEPPAIEALPELVDEAAQGSSSQAWKLSS